MVTQEFVEKVLQKFDPETHWLLEDFSAQVPQDEWRKAASYWRDLLRLYVETAAFQRNFGERDPFETLLPI
jgi:hypothetical protein